MFIVELSELERVELRKRIAWAAAEIESGCVVRYRDFEALLPWSGMPKGVRLLYIAQQGNCCHCGELMDLSPLWALSSSPSREHVIPACRGGKRVGNLVLAHRRCNMERGSRPATPELLRFAGPVLARVARWEAKAVARKLARKGARQVAPPRQRA